MMNSSSDVCKTWPLCGPSSDQEMFWVDPCFPLSNENISSYHSILFHWSCSDGDNPSYIGTWVVIYAYAMWLKPLLCFSIPTMTISLFDMFWWHKCEPRVPLFREVPMLLDIGNWLEQWLINHWGCSIIIQIISWGTNALLFIMRAINHWG